MEQQIVECTSWACEALKGFPQVNAWLLVIFSFLGVMLRAVSELLAFIALRFDDKEGKWPARLAEYSMFCAKVVGWFGGGKSKKIITWDLPEEKKE